MNRVLVAGLLACLWIGMTAPLARATNSRSGQTGTYYVFSGDTLKDGYISFSLLSDRSTNRFEHFPLVLADDVTQLPDALAIRTVTGLTAAYGMTDWLEFAFRAQHEALEVYRPGIREVITQHALHTQYRATQMTDVYLGFKVRLYDNPGRSLAAALVGTVKFPFGKKDDGFGTGEVDYGLDLAITKRFNNFGIHLNQGYTVLGESVAIPLHTDQYKAGLATEYFFTRRLQGVFEGAYSKKGFQNQANDNLTAALGARYHFLSQSETGEFEKYHVYIGAQATVQPLEDSQDNPYGFALSVGIAPMSLLYQYKSGSSTEEAKPAEAEAAPATSLVILPGEDGFTALTAGISELDASYSWTVDGKSTPSTGARLALANGEIPHSVACTLRDGRGASVSDTWNRP